MHPVLALWATPRSASTAFERMMIERGDHTVFDEPFSATYYFSPQRRSQRFTDTLPDSTAQEVMGRIRDAAAEGAVFIKDMATHALPYLGDEDLATMAHSFLVRDPRRAIPSMAKRWPDLTADEAGYRAQLALYRRVADTEPPVIDAERLRDDPPGTVRAWCAAVGIAPLERALRWDPGMQTQWRLWRDWYTEVATSSGFRPPTDGEPPPVDDERIAALIDDAMPCYEELASRALT